MKKNEFKVVFNENRYPINYTVNGKLVFNDDGTSNPQRLKSIFGYEYNFFKHDNGNIRVDDYLFVKRIDDLYDILETITVVETITTDEILETRSPMLTYNTIDIRKVNIESFKNVSIKSLDELYVYFPDLKMDLISEFDTFFGNVYNLEVVRYT